MLGAGSVAAAILGSTPQLARAGFSAFWILATLGRRVKKARRAFERQLIAGGMSKEDARRISAFYEELKDSIVHLSMRGAGLRSRF